MIGNRCPFSADSVPCTGMRALAVYGETWHECAVKVAAMALCEMVWKRGTEAAATAHGTADGMATRPDVCSGLGKATNQNPNAAEGFAPASDGDFHGGGE